MADLRIPSVPTQPPAGRSLGAPVRTDPARAAQAAFFQAAKGQAPTTAQPTPAPAKPAADPSPDRPLRPGSLLDIKV